MRPDAVLFCIRDGGVAIYSGNNFYHPVYRGLLGAGIYSVLLLNAPVKMQVDGGRNRICIEDRDKAAVPVPG